MDIIYKATEIEGLSRDDFVVDQPLLRDFQRVNVAEMDPIFLFGAVKVSRRFLTFDDKNATTLVVYCLLATKAYGSYEHTREKLLTGWKPQSHLFGQVYNIVDIGVRRRSEVTALMNRKATLYGTATVFCGMLFQFATRATLAGALVRFNAECILEHTMSTATQREHVHLEPLLTDKRALAKRGNEIEGRIFFFDNRRRLSVCYRHASSERYEHSCGVPVGEMMNFEHSLSLAWQLIFAPSEAVANERIGKLNDFAFILRFKKYFAFFDAPTLGCAHRGRNDLSEMIAYKEQRDILRDAFERIMFAKNINGDARNEYFGYFVLFFVGIVTLDDFERGDAEFVADAYFSDAPSWIDGRKAPVQSHAGLNLFQSDSEGDEDDDDE